MFKSWIAYFKDNPKGYWFKRKLFGWGWVPVSREGWAVTLVFIGILLGAATFLGEDPSESELMWFFVILVSVTVGVFAICVKTGEKPKWQWGVPKKYRKKKH